MILLPAIIWGVVAAWWTPRGPLTITQALATVAVSAAIGFATSRRMLVPVAFVLALELTRLTVFDVPSAEAPHGSLFGVVVLLAGRGLHLILTLGPMLLGMAFGRGVKRRFLVAVPTAGMLLLTAALAVPARTAPIPGGVAELARVGDLGVMIRGNRVDAPVLLFVPGAPGGSEWGAVRRHLGALEQRFVMATLDRRGGGSSYPALDPGITLDRLVEDTVVVTDYLRQRFHQDRIYLLGHSGGSIIAVLAARRHPAKFRAYVGAGQAVDLPASDRIFYADILAWARESGRADLARQLTEQGPPPYPDVWRYEPIMLYENQAYGQREPEFAVGVREYTLLQKLHTINAIVDTWDLLYPRMQDVDLRRDAAELAVPVWFVQGGNEMRGLAELFEQWYALLRAPAKQLITVPGAGHRAIFDEPESFAAVLDDVLAATT